MEFFMKIIWVVMKIICVATCNTLVQTRKMWAVNKTIRVTAHNARVKTSVTPVPSQTFAIPTPITRAKARAVRASTHPPAVCAQMV